MSLIIIRNTADKIQIQRKKKGTQNRKHSDENNIDHLWVYIVERDAITIILLSVDYRAAIGGKTPCPLRT